MEISVQKKKPKQFWFDIMFKNMQYNFIYMYVYMSKQYIGCIYVCMLKKTIVHSTCVCLDNSVHYTVICIWKNIQFIF